ncbi:MAG TPA: hypothetical protein VG651_07335 [Stellaceae bacterium]|nr:hypothetical protein [Stellaceae bacterium]
MNYGRPELGARLAADYVLGLMPRRARRRFERAMAGNATLAARVAGWSERFAPLDAAVTAEAPPARVWDAIDRRVGPGVMPGTMPGVMPARRRRWSPWWRGVALVAALACAAAVLYVAPDPGALHGDLQALADRLGWSDWAGSAPRAIPDIGLSTMRLGVPERERPRWLRAALLLSSEVLPLTTAPPPR